MRKIQRYVNSGNNGESFQKFAGGSGLQYCENLAMQNCRVRMYVYMRKIYIIMYWYSLLSLVSLVSLFSFRSIYRFC